ncbi:MAG: hypothetical protein ACJAWL_000520 [Motiliproteus sp.]
MDVSLNMDRRQKQFRLSSHMNIFVLLMTLFLLNGHCSVAYATSTPSFALINLQSDQQNTASDLLNVASNLDHDSNDASDCLDRHSDDLRSSRNFSFYTQGQDKQDGVKSLLASMTTLPVPRADACLQKFKIYSADFVTPPLFYSLCILRL